MIGGGKENDRQDKKFVGLLEKNRYFTMYGLGNNLDLSFRAFSCLSTNSRVSKW